MSETVIAVSNYPSIPGKLGQVGKIGMLGKMNNTDKEQIYT